MDNYFNGMMSTLKELVAFKTVLESAEENAPFGKTNRACLNRFYEISEEMGFEVKDVEGYAGHIEWKGQSEEILGILGHLDVVPEGEGWNSNPFELTIKEDGYAYGRGVLDDKGPVVACLYAMKKLKDEGYVPQKTIRLIVGCNEENGSTCVKRYFETEKMPDVGFSPDADFPVIHCEKGILWAGLTMPTALKDFKNITGGDKTNMVAQKATALYLGELSAEYFENKGLSVERDMNEMGLVLTARGKSAHGSTPSKGDNAIWHLIAVILEVEKDENLQYFYDTFCKDFDGTGSGLVCSDEKSGALTENVGTIEMAKGVIKASVDIRYPILLTKDKILDILRSNAPEDAVWSSLNDQEYLYVDPDDKLVTTLLGIYNKHAGSNSKSLIIGGGTYARELKYGVGFGPIFENEESSIHMPNEKLNLKNYQKTFDIYVDAIRELSKD